MTTQVDVQIAVEDESVPESGDIILWVSRAFQASGRGGEIEVLVRVVDETEMQKLNGEFRDQGKPTNVLAFPAGPIDGLPDDAELPLGDIVICAGVVRREAEEQNKAVSDHWAHMLVHGTLHLLGFDHINDSDTAVMENLEIQIMINHGIANPYRESPRGPDTL
ncbi:MAG: rRNA maturation RNase YbeY [Woeseiaceae bacterium]|jgi:probable rRNA maturation factor|nr:rRNA maturation RNase YbeY [Woeseiaceae bacterium]